MEQFGVVINRVQDTDQLRHYHEKQNLGGLPPLPGAIPSTDIFCPLHPRLCLVCALLGEEVLSATGKDLMQTFPL